MRTFVNFIAILFIGFLSNQSSFAKDNICPEKPGTALGMGNTVFKAPLMALSSAYAMRGSINASAILADCKQTIPNYKDRFDNISRNIAFDIVPSSNIDMTQKKYVYGIGDYYKLKNTTSTFLNTHGYISFKYRENTPEGDRMTYPMESAYNNSSQWNLSSGGPGKNHTPHAILEIVELKIYLDYYPLAHEVVNIKLGNVRTENLAYGITGEQEVFKGSDDVYITLDYSPELSSCNIETQTVYLKEVSLRNDLKNIGDEAGLTPFTVTANCNFSSTNIYYSLGDNMDFGNYSDVLTNTEEETKSIGIRIHDLDPYVNEVITLNKVYRFGDSKKGVASKKMAAAYYRKDDNKATSGPGKVSAQALISVVLW